MKTKLFNSLFPQLCPSCSEQSEFLFCDRCYDKIKWINNNGCQRCAEDHGPYLKPKTCPSCQHENWKLKKVIALASHETPFREAILQLKFGGSGRGARHLGNMLSERFNKEDFDILVPVPSPLFRRLKRGYNQAELIAQQLGRVKGLPVVKALNCPWKSTQIGQGAEERRRLSSSVFQLRHDVKGKRIALIDDVFTTGGTANACAHTLLKGGAQEVTSVVLARQFKKP